MVANRIAARDKKKFNVVEAMSMIVLSDSSDLPELKSNEDEDDLYQPKARNFKTNNKSFEGEIQSSEKVVSICS